MDQAICLEYATLLTTVRYPDSYRGMLRSVSKSRQNMKETYRRYLKDIEDASIITVKLLTGPKQMKLLDMQDLIMADRQIDTVVNSIPEFRAAHKGSSYHCKECTGRPSDCTGKRIKAGADEQAKVEKRNCPNLSVEKAS